ncbi:microtubule-associated protein 4-like [Acipenser oxyrinchus oxyrinchus]|uniref:Microtubule-associated protein 4-like n=1 Tax=Acipenser oxyrinchus oxyrinchus TaxID=40147 RepID=A0AAD8GGT7_ACIOX|nr:microtubule-associated protein 4-like [Acipenser oxyrinchus oxyrinchus]
MEAFYQTKHVVFAGAGASKVWLNTINRINGYEGGSVSVQCHYDLYFNTNVKYWCRGKVWRSCKVIQRSHEKQREEDKVSISDDRTRGVFTVTVRRLEKKDADWYWCGIDRAVTDEGIQLNLKVADGKKKVLEPASAKTLELSPAVPSKVETKHPEGQNLKAASVEQKTTEKDTHPGHQQQMLTAVTQKKDLPKAAKKVLKKNGDKMRPKEGRAAPEVKGYIRATQSRSAQRPDNKTPGPRAQDEPSPRHVSCEEEDVLQRTATGPDEGAFVPA